MFGYYKSVNNYLDLAYHPVETAMTNGDDLVHLLVRLGASVNTIPKIIAESSYYENKTSLKVWIDSEISKLDTRIKSVKAPAAASITIPPECSGWKKFYREYQESLKVPTEKEKRKQVLHNEREERERLEMLEKLEDAKAYFVEVKQLIEDHGAKILGKVPTVETPSPGGNWSGSPSNVEPNPYKFLSTGYRSHDVPQHLLSSYDQLYEACYVGDHAKIQSLCLPSEGAQPGSILLNISVKIVESTDNNFNGKKLPEATCKCF